MIVALFWITTKCMEKIESSQSGAIDNIIGEASRGSQTTIFNVGSGRICNDYYESDKCRLFTDDGIFNLDKDNQCESYEIKKINYVVYKSNRERRVKFKFHNINGNSYTVNAKYKNTIPNDIVVDCHSDIDLYYGDNTKITLKKEHKKFLRLYLDQGPTNIICPEYNIYMNLNVLLTGTNNLVIKDQDHYSIVSLCLNQNPLFEHIESGKEIIGGKYSFNICSTESERIKQMIDIENEQGTKLGDDAMSCLKKEVLGKYYDEYKDYIYIIMHDNTLLPNASGSYNTIIKGSLTVVWTIPHIDKKYSEYNDDMYLIFKTITDVEHLFKLNGMVEQPIKTKSNYTTIESNAEYIGYRSVVR